MSTGRTKRVSAKFTFSSSDKILTRLIRCSLGKGESAISTSGRQHLNVEVDECQSGNRRYLAPSPHTTRLAVHKMKLHLMAGRIRTLGNSTKPRKVIDKQEDKGHEMEQVARKLGNDIPKD